MSTRRISPHTDTLPVGVAHTPNRAGPHPAAATPGASDPVATGALGTGELPGAASVALRPTVCRPPGSAAVLASFPTAVYLSCGTAAAGDRPTVLALVTRDALRLPNAVVLPVLATARLFHAVAPGDPAWVGSGAVWAGPLRIRVRRWWSAAVPARPHHHTELAHRLGALGRALGTEPDVVRQALTHALSAAMAEDDTPGVLRTARQLLGSGPGLTPAGDDVLAGFLLTLRVFGAMPGSLAREIVALAGDRTTAVSAALLAHAARGEAIPELRDLLDAVRGYGEVPATTRRLVRVGHTSGHSLGLGVLAAGRALLARGPDRGSDGWTSWTTRRTAPA